MMQYIESPSNDPHFNLALEQYVFDSLDRGHEYFMLWQNHNAIIVGKHQNTIGEINPAYVKEREISVVRRLSGGGAVYHDMGNLNFTFIVDLKDQGGFDFASFCRPVVAALASLGVPAEIAGRNDMVIDGQKFSGNSQYVKQGRVMHHGTILYDSDLEVVTQALNVPKDKIESKGLKSVRSRITNVKPHMREDLPISAFLSALRDFMFREHQLIPYTLTQQDLEAVRRLQEEVYDRWDWNYGASPAYTMRKERRVEGCGKIEMFMDVQKGILEGITFYGDYFSQEDPAGLAELLIGCPLEENALRQRLEAIDPATYFRGADTTSLLTILLQ